MLKINQIKQWQEMETRQTCKKKGVIDLNVIFRSNYSITTLIYF
jgi:hypothetical protein